MKVTDVRAAYPKWRQRLPADAWQAHFWQIAVRVTTDAGVIGHGYGGGGQPAVHVINDHFSRFLVGRIDRRRPATSAPRGTSSTGCRSPTAAADWRRWR